MVRARIGWNDVRLSAQAPFAVLVVVEGDQPGRTVNLGHHRVAGVDAKATVDAAELGPFADVDAGRADGDALQAIDAVACGLAMRVGLGGILYRHARLAPIEAIGDVERLVVGQRRLDARPRAHVEADLLAQVAGKGVGRQGQDSRPDVGDRRRLQGEELPHQRRRVDEIEHRGAAGRERDQEPDRVLGDPLRDLLRGPGLSVELYPIAPVALDPALDPEVEIGPDRLRTSVAAPHPAEERVRQEQDQRRQDQQACEIIDFLRPDLDEEEVEAGMRDVGKNRLVRQVRSPIPADERQHVVDAEGDPQHDPFDAPVSPPNPLWVDFLGRFIQWTAVVGLLGYRHEYNSVLFPLY